MKTFIYSLDSLFSKSIKVDTHKCKTVYDLKKEIASDLHTNSTNISILNEKNDELSKVEYNHEFIVKINFRYESLTLVFRFPEIFLNIYIENCYKMTFDEIIDEFKKKQLFYSSTCIKHYIQFKNSGNEVLHIKYPFIAITSDSHIQVEMKCEYVIIKYGYKKFILSDTEHVYDANNLIQKIYSNSKSVLLLDRNKKERLGYEKLNKYETYNIVVLYTVRFQDINNFKSYFSQEIDFLTKVDEVKQIIAQKYSKNDTRLYKYDIRLFDEFRKPISDSFKTLKSYQYLDKVFYFDTGSNNQVKISPKKLESHKMSNKDGDQLNSYSKHTEKNKKIDDSYNNSTKVKFESKDNYNYNSDDDIEITDDETNSEFQSTNESISNDSSDYYPSHQAKPIIRSDQKNGSKNKDDDCYNKQTIKPRQQIWPKHANQSYNGLELNSEYNSLNKEGSTFNNIKQNYESKFDINYTDSNNDSNVDNLTTGIKYHFTNQNIIYDESKEDNNTFNNNRQKSKYEPANPINITDSNDDFHQNDQTTVTKYQLNKERIIHNDLKGNSKTYNNNEPTSYTSYTDSNDDSYINNPTTGTKYHQTKQNIIHDDFKGNNNTLNNDVRKSKYEPSNHTNYTDSSGDFNDKNHQSDQTTVTKYQLNKERIIHNDLKGNSKTYNNNEPTSYTSYTDSNDDSYINNPTTGTEYHQTQQNIIHDDFKGNNGTFNNTEPTYYNSYYSYTDSKDVSYEKDQPTVTKYHLTKQNIIHDDLKEDNNKFNDIKPKSKYEPTSHTSFTESSDDLHQSNQQAGTKYHLTKEDIIHDDLKEYDNTINNIEPTNNTNYTDSNDDSYEKDQPIVTKYHLTKQNIIHDDLKENNNTFNDIKPKSKYEPTNYTSYTDSNDDSYANNQSAGTKYHLTKENIIHDDLNEYNDTLNNNKPESKYEPTNSSSHTDSNNDSNQSDQPTVTKYHLTKQNIFDDDINNGKEASYPSNSKFTINNRPKPESESQYQPMNHFDHNDFSENKNEGSNSNAEYHTKNQISNENNLSNSEKIQNTYYFDHFNDSSSSINNANKTTFCEDEKSTKTELNQKQKSVSDDIFISNDYNDIEVSDESEIKHYSHALKEEEDKNELFYKKEDDNPKLHYMQSSSSEYEKHANAIINDNIVLIEEEEEMEDENPSQNDNQRHSSHNIISTNEKNASTNIDNDIVLIEEEEEETDNVTPSQDDNQHHSSHNILSFSSDDNNKE